MAANYEVLDLKVQLYDAQTQLENVIRQYNSSQSQIENLKRFIALTRFNRLIFD